MGFLSNFRKDLQTSKINKAAQINGKNLKELLKKFKEERDRIEKDTGVRPQIDEEKFWEEVDHNRQFTHPVEYYEIKR